MSIVIALAIVLLGLTLVVCSAIGLSTLGLIQYRLSRLLSPELRLVVALTVIAGGALLTILMTSRTLDDAQRDAANFVAYEDYARGFAVSRWLSLLLVTTALVEVLRGMLNARRSSTPDPARSILWAICVFYGGTALVEAFASDHPGFSYKDLYLPIAMMAAYHQRIESLRDVLTAAKWGLFGLTAGSLAFMLIQPDFVLHRPEAGLFPGMDGRLYGLTSHANTLGPAALLAIVLEMYQPSSRLVLRAAHLFAAISVVLLAESRTAWAAAGAIALCVVLPLALRPGREADRRLPAQRRAMWTVVACVAIAAVVVPGVVWSGRADLLLQAIDRTSLNGRTQIWEITLQAWHDNVIFGYGPDIWGIERQWQFHMFHVGHAHNQVVQTLGESGLTGLALLLIYVTVFLRAAVLRFATSRGLVLALLLILLARFVTEAPMRSEGPLSWSAFLHVLLVVAASYFLRQQSDNSPARVSAERANDRAGEMRSHYALRGQ